MDDDQREIWFPAKGYGWGWSLPVAWQGWVVLLVYVVLVLLGVAEFRQSQDPRFFAYLVLITAALIAICWQKGETPRWRWGSPTILIDGAEVTGQRRGEALSCRAYATPDKVPAAAAIVAAIESQMRRY